MAWDDLSYDEQDRIGGALHPFGRRRFTNHRQNGYRFAHYTSADAAVKMISQRRVWMRRANAMNDFSELEYGVARLEEARAGRSWTAFCAALDAAQPGSADLVTAALPLMIDNARAATFLTALSEHPPEENDLGRLSMWRAYGGDMGVCIVLDPGVLLRPSRALEVFNHPVSYSDDAEFQRMLLVVAGSLLGEIALLRRMQAEEVALITLGMLRDTILCTKHPGFAEEREWRLIHSPRAAPSPRVLCEVLTIHGEPQPVHLIPLRDIPDEGLHGIEPKNLVERIIIGPTSNPGPMREGLVETLRAADVDQPECRVVVSAIPLRR